VPETEPEPYETANASWVSIPTVGRFAGFAPPQRLEDPVSTMRRYDTEPMWTAAVYVTSLLLIGADASARGERSGGTAALRHRNDATLRDVGGGSGDEGGGDEES